MTPDLMLSLLKITGSVALLTGVLFAASRFGKRAGLSPEGARKVVHVGLGLYALTFPWLFHAWWEVAATCALALGVFALARGVARKSLGEGLHGVERVSLAKKAAAFSRCRAPRAAPGSRGAPCQLGTVLGGQTVVLSVTAFGAAPLLYQWYFNGSTIPAGTSASLAQLLHDLATGVDAQ